MGTSQSHNLKTSPNWASAKRSITSIAKKTGNTNDHCKSFVSRLGAAIGDGIYRGSRAHGHGDESTFGRGGSRMSINLVSFIGDIQANGLSDVLKRSSLSLGQQPVTKEDFIDRILLYLSGEHDSSMDDDAAICAMDKLLNEILKDCATPEEIENKFKEATNDDMVLWMIDFEIEYILEYSAELFQSHIFDKCSNPDETIDQIRNWLHNEIDDRLKGDLSRHNLSSSEGKQLLDTLTVDILDIWKQE